MWVRKRIDIGWSDLLRGSFDCLRSPNDLASESIINEVWRSKGRFPLVCLSVRSGFDLLLTDSGFEPGDEIAMSALTIPDMPRIVREHGLLPVPIDVEPRTMNVTPESLRAAISDRTRAVVIAHLFGGRVPLEPIVEICRDRGLLLIEDCAQAFAGYSNHAGAVGDVAMFSFGPIKTHSSLIGAVLTSTDSDRMTRMAALQQQWPQLDSGSYFQRLAKYGFVKSLSLGPVAGTVAGFLRLLGRNHDRLATNMARGFAGGDFFAKIRHRPSSASLAMLAKRFQRFSPKAVDRRRELGERFRRRVGDVVAILGAEAVDPTYWVLPIEVSNGEELVPILWRAGFDATQASSLQAIAAPEDRPHLEPRFGRMALESTVFLPLSHRMSDSTVDRMADLVRANARPLRSAPTHTRHMISSTRPSESMSVLRSTP